MGPPLVTHFGVIPDDVLFVAPCLIAQVLNFYRTRMTLDDILKSDIRPAGELRNEAGALYAKY